MDDTRTRKIWIGWFLLAGGLLSSSRFVYADPPVARSDRPHQRVEVLSPASHGAAQDPVRLGSPDGSAAVSPPAEAGQGSLLSFQSHLQQLVEKVGPATVGVSGGSGVVVSPDGLVLCVSHVCQSAGRRLRVTFADGRRERAVVVGTHQGIDGALLQLQGDGPWPYAVLAVEQPARRGDWVMAVGYPVSYRHGDRPSVRVGRCLQVSDEAVVTDCPIMGGDSGGPLFDLQGRLVAISSRCGDSLHSNIHVPLGQFQAEWARLSSGRDWAFGSQRRSLPKRPEWDAGCGTETPELAASFPQAKADGTVVVRKPALAWQTTLRPESDRSAGGRRSRGRSALFRRDAAEIREFLQPAIEAARQVTATLLLDGSPAGSGTLLEDIRSDDPARYLVTKASRLPYHASHRAAAIRCAADGKGSEVAAEWLGVETSLDLAMFRLVDPAIATQASTLSNDDSAATTDQFQLTSADGQAVLDPEPPAGEWSIAAAVPAVGSFLVSIAASGEPQIGFLSAGPRSYRLRQPAWGGNRPMLGVAVLPDDEGVRVTAVVPDTAADEIGLRRGDVIRDVDQIQVGTADELASVIAAHGIGDSVELSYSRTGEIRQRRVELGAFQPATSHPSVYDRWGGGPFSARRFDIPAVLAHDAAVDPDDCGGPVVDMAGELVGVNIARALRVATYAVPIDRVWQAIDGLQEQN